MRRRKPWAQAPHQVSPASMTVRRPPHDGQMTWNKEETMDLPYPFRCVFNGTL